MTSKISWFGDGESTPSRYIYHLEQENKQKKKVIDRLSRKIQRIKKASISNSEVTTLLYAIDLVIQNFGDNENLEKIYNKLYDYRKGIIENEKKKFYR